MNKTRKKKPFAHDLDNVAFVRGVEELGEFGLTQQDIAEVLSISPGQLSRVKNGDRHAARHHIKTIREQVRQLEKERTQQRRSRRKPFSSSILSVDYETLGQLSPEDAVKAFRDLLWARAAERALPTTQISISADIHTADGGVDALIVQDSGFALYDDDLLASGSRYQIKTGQFTAWQRSTIKDELFGKKPVRFENLGAAVQETLRDSGRFVLVCFGIDPTPDRLERARKHLASFFADCGYSDTRIAIWGQTKLIGLFERYPSLCIRLNGHDQRGFRSHMSWGRDDDMGTQVHYSPELQNLMEELRRQLHSGEIRHLRLLGEPGVGKSRMALELTSDTRFKHVTVYVNDGQSFARSSFINELIQSDDHRFVVIVIDECPRSERAEIWNIIKPRSDRIRLITIDHGPDEVADDQMRIVPVAPTGDDEIIAILRDHDISENDARRWAEFCEGCPRVAHVLGENLRLNRGDLLNEPATVEVWNRFIVGYDDPDSEEVRLRKQVLQFVSLFERFGFDSPVEEEARFIADLAGLRWYDFRSTVLGLKRRRILQGETTLFLTPRLLQVHLYREFWEICGADFDVTETLRAMPAPLQHWFIKMLRYAHVSQNAMRAIDVLLGPQGLFPGNAFPGDQLSGRLLQALAESSPKATLRCLKRTIGGMEVERLSSLSESRHWVVRALELLAAREKLFAEASLLLLKMAETESSNNHDFAARSFTDLFSLIPGMAATEAAPATRLAVLAEALESDSRTRRQIALNACEAALATWGGHRFIGPEYQGLRETIQFWFPKTYGELWSAHRDVWTLLTAKLRTWTGEDRKKLIEALIKAAWSALHIPTLTPAVLSTLESICHDPATDTKELVELIQRQLRLRRDNLSPETAEALRAIHDSLDGTDFHSRLTRFVRHATREDLYSDDGERTGILDQKLDELAADAINDPRLLIEELPWLVCEQSNPNYHFAFRIGQRDSSRDLLPEIVASHARIPSGTSSTFLSGYLGAVFNDDPPEWEEIMLRLSENASIASVFSDIVIGSGISDRVVQRVITLCQAGGQSVNLLERWWFSSQLRKLKPEVMEGLIQLQLEGGSGATWNNAINMWHTYYLQDGGAGELPRELTLRLLTDERIADGRVAHSAGYYWSRLASAYIEHYPESKWDLFRGVLRASSKDWSILSDLERNEEAVMERLLQEDPETAFDCISEFYRDAHGRDTFGVQHWLAGDGHTFGSEPPGPIQYVPAKKLFDWVDENVDGHGWWLCRTLPKTLDQSAGGRLTRDFIAKYANDEGIAHTLYAHFHSRSFCGEASECYRRLREEAREWLENEENPTVIRWIEDYIDGLSGSIEYWRIDEERRF